MKQPSRYPYRPMFAAALLGIGLLCASSPSPAATVVVPSKQVGTFFDDGSAANTAGFQNYHVGYSTLSTRAESRAFFIVDLPFFDPGLGELIGIEFALKLPFGGLVFGGQLDESDPSKVVGDTEETFALTLSPVPADMVTLKGLTPDEALMVFESLGPGKGLLGSKTFAADAPLDFLELSPPVYFPLGVTEIVVPFTSAGIELFTTATHAGSTVVLGGHMASFSKNDETYPSGPMAGTLVEKSEEIFGLTDVVAHVPPLGMAAPTGLPYPELRFLFAPVPEPDTWLLMTLGGAILFARRRQHCARRNLRSPLSRSATVSLSW